MSKLSLAIRLDTFLSLLALGLLNYVQANMKRFMNYWMILKKDLIGKIYGFIGIKIWKVKSSFFMFFLVIIEPISCHGLSFF